MTNRTTKRRQNDFLRCSQRLQKLAEFKDLVEKDAAEAATTDAQEKRKRRAQAEASGVGTLANVSPEEARHQYDYFDLNDEPPDKCGVDPEIVTELVLDEMSETLRERDSEWEKCRNPVRRVLLNKRR